MVKNRQDTMEYRSLGKTNEKISVITLGAGCKHNWEEPKDFVPEDTIQELTENVQTAFSAGINIIDTAYGYPKSEHAFGIVLNDVLKIPRDSYYLMTKSFARNGKTIRKNINEQLKACKTDYFDFYGFHGINNHTSLSIVTMKNGPLEELYKMKDEGIIKHIGFTTHAPLDVIINAINTDLFEFVGLQYFYFFQRNSGAIALAENKNMGVIIVSPNDKGGQLGNAPEKLRQLTLPLTPIQWNTRFCLQKPAVSSLIFGMNGKSHFKEMEGIFPASIPLSRSDHEILLKLENAKLSDPYSLYDGYDLAYDPSGISIAEILRLRMMWKCFDMIDFCRYRYNFLLPEHHWFPGKKATPENLEKIDTNKVPPGIPLKELLLEAHNAFNEEGRTYCWIKY